MLATFPRLAERLTHGGWQLSGGEQQMLTIGRALMTNPELLILDEATEGLAPQIAREIWRIIGEIRRHGIATVIVDKLPGGHRDHRPQRDPGQGTCHVRGRQPRAAHPAGHPAQAPRRVAAMPFVTVAARRIEYERIAVARAPRPTLVFLHEGFGSVAMWREFPSRVAHAANCDAVVYSRYGYGGSDPLAEDRTPRYMHDEALVALPELLAALAIDRPILVGHSDGGSIALIHAGAGCARCRRR